jgi:hypothetical protein
MLLLAEDDRITGSDQNARIVLRQVHLGEHRQRIGVLKVLDIRSNNPIVTINAWPI